MADPVRRRGAEHASGHIVVERRPDRRGRRRARAGGRAATGRAGSTAPAAWPPRAWSTPTTTCTSGRPEGWRSRPTLFDWLTELYPVWARIDADVRPRARPTAGLGLAGAVRAARTSTDHHYVFPRGRRRPARRPRSRRRRRDRRLRFHPMPGLDGPRPVARAACRPTRSSRTATRSWPRPRRRSTASTTPRPARWLRIAVAPCSPFSRHRGADARVGRAGPRAGRPAAHPPGRDARRGGATAGRRSAARPAEYADDLGWLGEDVWLAHCVHLDESAIKRLAATGTGGGALPHLERAGWARASPRSASCCGPVPPVGLGVDGPASSEGTTAGRRAASGAARRAAA